MVEGNVLLPLSWGKKYKLSIEEVRHFPCCQPFRRPRAIMRSLLPSCRHGSSALVFSPAQLFKTHRYDLSYCLPKEDTFHLVTCGTKLLQLALITNFLLYHIMPGRGWNNYNSPILIPVGSTNSESCLTQTDEVFWRKIGESVDLPCTISAPCSGQDWMYYWLLCKESFCSSVKLHENLHKYKLNGASLHVTALHANDSGIYHCAAVSPGGKGQGSQHVGLGTTLVVKGKREKLVQH